MICKNTQCVADYDRFWYVKIVIEVNYKQPHFVNMYNKGGDFDHFKKEKNSVMYCINAVRQMQL